MNQLKKAALHVMAMQLSDDKINAMRAMFKSLDSNGDGMLTSQELESGIAKAGVRDADLQRLIKEMDVDGSGVIDYTEFIAVAVDARHAAKEENCWAAFTAFDKDGNGKISMTELRDLLRQDGVSETVGQQNARVVMDEVDKNKDGEIDFSEFKAM